MSAASLGLNIIQDMSEPVFEMKFESLPPTSKVGYRLVFVGIVLLDHVFPNNYSGQSSWGS